MASESQLEKVRNLVSSGFCNSSSLSDISAANLIVNQMQSFESNPELFNLTTGMEMLAFPSKTNNNNTNRSSSDAAAAATSSSLVMWKGFLNEQPTTSTSNPSGSLCSSKTIINDSTATDFYQTEYNKSDFSSSGLISQSTSENLILAPDHHSSWQDHNNNNKNNRLIVDDSSLRCLYPCDRPSQGLSLSLSSNKTIRGLQSFDVRETNHHHHHEQEDVFFRKSPINNFQSQQQQQVMQDGFLGKSSIINPTHFHIKNSKYLVPAQELLNEFCSIGTKQTQTQKQKVQKINQLEDENGSDESSRKQSFMYSLDLLELQKRKTKLVSMLEEVDKRYRQYCDQMKTVVLSFETVIGSGAASVYSALASKAMSKHFRCLRDGIVDQIRAIKKATGEKEPVAPGTTKGETPRLRLLDQTLRQQRAFQQMTMMESHPWRPQRGLPERSVSVLRAWLFEHFLHPYPSDVDKHILARQTGLSRSQVSNWFINARVRLWKPMVEEMYLEETKEQDNIASSSVWITGISNDDDDNSRLNQNLLNLQKPQFRLEDKKPTPDQLIRSDSESLSSIINENGKATHSHYHNYHQQAEQQLQQLGRIQLAVEERVSNENFGLIDLDFSSYNNEEGVNQQNSIGNGVSLTLGLQQHGGSGMNLSFEPVTQHSLFFPRDQIDNVDEQVQYSILDGEEQNLPYQNLMGSQLLHDFA